MKALSLPSPAKLNLFLHILDRRDDGYHNIQTVFQFINWCDTLDFRLRSDSVIRLSANKTSIANSDNLVLKAAYSLQKATTCLLGADIKLKKILPIGAGVGGGSSNAATTLLALNQLWQTSLNTDNLLTLGSTLGADVPIFIYGHAAWAEGIGDQLTPMVLPEPWYLLLVPQISIKTSSLFSDPRLTPGHKALKIDHSHIDQGQNDFEKLACLDYPDIAEALNWMGQFSKARMTGTGSVIFAKFDSREEADRIATQAPPAYQAKVVRGLNRSPLYEALK